ncbi:hypothetical protein F4Z99_10985, partial [Candidatus Poribacteria bacterium]|nr:hypothetical protein [Candidatus Poribacteria bacterium]
ISPLSGLTTLAFLNLSHNQISDIRPLAGLTGLGGLKLANNQIVDISPLAGLVNLNLLNIANNRITDFSPLAGLNLQSLNTKRNISVDLSMIDTSKITNLVNDLVCDIQRPSAYERVQRRDYPSLLSSWGHVLEVHENKFENIPIHDLYFCCPNDLHLYWELRSTANGPKPVLIDHIFEAKQRRAELLLLNPNLVMLVPIIYYTGVRPDYKEVGLDYIPDNIFLRDEQGNIVEEFPGGELLLDFTLPQTQQWVKDQVLAISQCGLFDGIILDHWDLKPKLRGYRTLEEEYAARNAILQSIREIDDDLLILVNAGTGTHAKIPRWAPYINGIWLETGPEANSIYDDHEIAKIQEALLWAETEAPFREPVINAISGGGNPGIPPDSSETWKVVRSLTTLALTHSDAYLIFKNGGTISNRLWGVDITYKGVHSVWLEFWDDSLGYPIGGDETKGQLYDNREGLFIREFTNGWAVYNRSGMKQQIEFSEAVSGVASGVMEKRSHILPDLDGEIYLKSESRLETPPTADVNGDGVVNILDLVIIANAFGEAEPDLNGDGVVNIQDLVIVANAFE